MYVMHNHLALALARDAVHFFLLHQHRKRIVKRSHAVVLQVQYVSVITSHFANHIQNKTDLNLKRQREERLQSHRRLLLGNGQRRSQLPAKHLRHKRAGRRYLLQSGANR